MNIKCHLCRNKPDSRDCEHCKGTGFEPFPDLSIFEEQDKAARSSLVTSKDGLKCARGFHGRSKSNPNPDVSRHAPKDSA